jgi:hypothetical protein
MNTHAYLFGHECNLNAARQRSRVCTHCKVQRKALGAETHTHPQFEQSFICMRWYFQNDRLVDYRSIRLDLAAAQSATITGMTHHKECA